MLRYPRSFAILMAAVFCLPTLVNAAVGYTPGSFNVNGTGAATYSIPIAVPPGAAGIQPSLALVYSSQSGNGLLGVGWSLSGLSAITRCPQTYARDGNQMGVKIAYSDRYCLDGQRLILISGSYGYANSEYRTEIDTLTRIIAYGTAGNGPSYFIAQTKSGQTIQYGNTADSQILASGTGTVAVWAANRISDTLTNYLTISYCQYGSTGYCGTNPVPAVGEFYPARIDYAGNTTQSTATSSSVQFVYTTRSDTSVSYVENSTISTSVRLANVKIYEGASLLRDYRLAFDNVSSTGHSRLNSLTECDGSNNCLPATTLTWQDRTPGFAAAVSTSTPIASYAQVLDVNGDGYQDLVFCSSATGTW